MRDFTVINKNCKIKTQRTTNDDFVLTKFEPYDCKSKKECILRSFVCLFTHHMAFLSRRKRRNPTTPAGDRLLPFWGPRAFEDVTVLPGLSWSCLE